MNVCVRLLALFPISNDNLPKKENGKTKKHLHILLPCELGKALGAERRERASLRITLHKFL